MAQETAQYAALRFQNDKIPDFGDIALDLVDRQIAAKERQYQKDMAAVKFQNEMVKNNQDVFYPSFENSGIKNVDVYNSKMAGLIKNQISQYNQEFQNSRQTPQDMQRYQMRVAKLRGETQQYNNNMKAVIAYGQKVTELGDKASAVMYDNVMRIDNMMQHGVPTIDKNGNMVNASIFVDEEGNKQSENIKFSEMNSLTSIHQMQDKFGVATNAVKAFGKDSRFIDDEGEVVINTLLGKDGKMQDSAKQIIRGDVSALSDSDIIDLADQFDLEDPIRDDSGRLVNKGDLLRQIGDKEIEYAESLLKEKSYSDEVAFKEIDIRDKTYGLRLRQLRQRQKESRGSLPYRAAYITDEMDTSGEGKRIEYYMKKDIAIESANLKEELKFNTILGQRGIDVQGDVNILSYKENDRFGDQVKVQYTIETGEGDRKEKKVIEEFIPLEARALELNNRIRTRIGLNPRSVDAKTYYNTGTVPQGPTPTSTTTKKKPAY